MTTTTAPIMWRISDIPAGYTGSVRCGTDRWVTRCRGCGLLHVEHAALPMPRYATIGRHEYAAHQLEVPGINVGMLK